MFVVICAIGLALAQVESLEAREALFDADWLVREIEARLVEVLAAHLYSLLLFQRVWLSWME